MSLYNPPISYKSGKVIYVSSNGDDASGARETPEMPFLTLSAAKAAALSGDTIVVFPGAYTCAASLAKNGVNWFFYPGASVTNANNAATTGIWDDGGSAMTFTVAGQGDFTRTSTALAGVLSAVMCSHASSDILIECRDIFVSSNSDDETYVVAGFSGRLIVRARELNGDGGTGAGVYTAYWRNGPMHVTAEKITGAGCGVYGLSNATPTGDFTVIAHEILSKNIPIYFAGTDTAAAIWVKAHTIKSHTNNLAAVSMDGSGRLYVDAQKIFGRVITGGAGLNYVKADKISAYHNGTGTTTGLINIGAGTTRITCAHLDPAGFTGTMMNIAGGDLRIMHGDYTGVAFSNGLTISGGTLRLRNCRIDTSLNSINNPITKSGGVLVLESCVLVAEATRSSIFASTAQNVVAYGSFANKAVDGNITMTITGGWNVDSDVI